MTPDKYTNQTINLPVGDGHKLHIVDWGNKNAKTPYIYLHGGPGGGISDRYKRFFDPKIHRVIFFDQRGCGESTPYGSLRNNDTKHLSEDVIKIADHFKLDQFNLYGYSWGSTLGLYTAINYPDRVKNLVIGGVYSGENDFIKMFDYLKSFFPEKYDEILAQIPKEHHKNPVKYYQDQVMNGAPSAQKRASFIINQIEMTIMSYDSDLELEKPYEEYDPIPAKIETYITMNGCFMPKDYLLKNAHKITASTYIIQGRADLVCPPEFAYQISKEIKNVKIYWANSNHHSQRELTTLARTVISLID